ncbi:hypothetical protein GCM10020358_39730 [Amorphoplanes nipponensis]|uniref:Uncharacterized protein n=1 Tax=Actinoplanes nipponensis TaxID=135950 RepID=A0A919MIQ0_9ACTN|nr:hypothetical protein [Actinoplanes nipponensis]GIE50989.1 hypothetical protein Ani05nite_45230 [Actinoplanes nipponensis]
MTERARAEPRSTVGGLHLQVSGLLLGSLIAAVAATGALIITLAVGLPPGHPPPGPNGMPPPPPDLTSLAVFPVITGVFVLAWLAVVVAYSRDQILRRIEQLKAGPGAVDRPFDQLIAELRAQLAADREQELRLLQERIAELTEEYGEQRETDGYLNGMRIATGDQPPPAKVHSIRRTPHQP